MVNPRQALRAPFLAQGGVSPVDPPWRTGRRDRQSLVDRRAARRPAGLAAYAASKGAVETFTKGFAAEVGPEGIRVNAVAPGMIETDMTDDLLSQPGARDRIAAMTPLGRVGAPNDIAEAAAWLILPTAAFVTGSVLTVSGGR